MKQDNRTKLPFVHALAEATIPLDTIDLADADIKKVTATVSEYVHGQLECLPIHLRIVFNLGMLGFRLVVRARHLRGFSRLPLDQRREIVNSWAYGRVALARQLFRVVRSTSLLAFYEIPEVKAVLDMPSTQEKTIGKKTQ